MSREIKFRVWDDKQKCYRLDAGKSIEIVGGFLNSLYPEEKTGFIIQQFIGLLDTNDKEIYEGDIVQEIDGSISVIEWNSTSFCLRAISGRCLSSRNLVSAIQNECGLFCKIIGNIFQNTELLKTS